MPEAACSPRVVGEHRPDFHSLESILEHPRFAGKHGEALVLAIYDYFTSTTDGTWHFWTPNEAVGHPCAWGDVTDPVKLLNAYGWMLCGPNAMMLQGIYRAAGLPSRIRQLPGHVVCEVFYDDRWHILDVDMWTWFRVPQGHIASIEELSADPRALVADNRRTSWPCSLPDRRLEDYATMYAEAGRTGSAIFPFWASRCHTMDFSLRPGETLLRSQTHANRFHVPASWSANIAKSAGLWHGLPRERYHPHRTIGNGRWSYAPDLSARTRDVELGAWTRDGLTQDGDGLVGPGSIVFRIQTPYPFCGAPETVLQEANAQDGFRIKLSGSGPVRTEITDAEGRWVDIATGEGERCADLSCLMTTRYSAMLRLTLDVGSRVDRLACDGWLQVAPMSLPRLEPGANRMHLRCGDRFGCSSVPWPVTVDFRSEATLRSHMVGIESGILVPGKRDRLRLMPPDTGPAVGIFRFDAPTGRPFAWAYAVATVPEGSADALPMHATVEWSYDGSEWQPLSAIAIPNTPLQWDGSIDGLVRLPAPAPQLWLRVGSGTGVTALEFAGHIAAPVCPGTLRIVHRWQEPGGRREVTVPQGAASWSIDCGPGPHGHEIELHMPSVRLDGHPGAIGPIIP